MYWFRHGTAQSKLSLSSLATVSNQLQLFPLQFWGLFLFHFLIQLLSYYKISGGSVVFLCCKDTEKFLISVKKCYLGAFPQTWSLCLYQCQVQANKTSHMSMSRICIIKILKKAFQQLLQLFHFCNSTQSKHASLFYRYLKWEGYGECLESKLPRQPWTCAHTDLSQHRFGTLSLLATLTLLLLFRRKQTGSCAHSATTATTNCNNCEDCRTFNVFKKMSVLVYAPTHLSPHTHTESTWTLLPGNPSHPKAPSTDSALTWHQAQAGSGLQHSQPSDQMTGKSKGLINMEL